MGSGFLDNRVIIGIVAVIVVIAAVAGYYYMSAPSAPATIPTVEETTIPTVEETTPQAINGGSLFEANCMPCHGAKGEGGSAPALTANNADRSTIENGNLNEGMPAFRGSLSPEEITAILEYLQS
jgi:mono/diheme cytochrome c family protein